MKDKYINYAALKTAKQEGRDYQIVVRTVTPSINAVVIGPHAGRIEEHISTIATAVVGDDIDLYLFEGLMPSENKDLHITSENFDEPKALKLLATKSLVIAIHGREDKDDLDRIYLGGRDNELTGEIARQLEQVGFVTLADGHQFPGEKATNICNRGATNQGSQLEIPKSIRKRLARDSELLGRFRDALRAAILRLEPTRRSQQPGSEG